jgi:hypothetical protein
VDVTSDTAARSAKRNSGPASGHATAAWTFGGRRAAQWSSRLPTKPAGLQRVPQSPLTDSNRRPPPYHFPGGTGGHGRALAITFLLQIPAFAACLACPRVPARARADVPVSYPRAVYHLANKTDTHVSAMWPHPARRSSTTAASKGSATRLRSRRSSSRTRASKRSSGLRSRRPGGPPEGRPARRHRLSRARVVGSGRRHGCRSSRRASSPSRPRRGSGSPRRCGRPRSRRPPGRRR